MAGRSAARPLPPIIPDQVTKVASLLPPLAQGPYDIDGTFTFDALNVYFNAPVDVDIASAMPVGSAGTIRFFIDHQRTSVGLREGVDWPILLQELAVNPDGSVTATSPANVPLFEQIRTSQPGLPGAARRDKLPAWPAWGRPCGRLELRPPWRGSTLCWLSCRSLHDSGAGEPGRCKVDQSGTGRSRRGFVVRS